MIGCTHLNSGAPTEKAVWSRETSAFSAGPAGQGGGTPIDAVLQAATAVKTNVNSQAEIFSMVNSQATISF